jgi:hypothetical protein
MSINFTDRVRRGIARLEEYEPGSTNRIDLGAVDTYSLGRCPLAQAIGGGEFGRGRQRLGIPWDDDVCGELGFALMDSEADRAEWQELYAQLDAAWRTELAAFRAATPA